MFSIKNQVAQSLGHHTSKQQLFHSGPPHETLPSFSEPILCLQHHCKISQTIVKSSQSRTSCLLFIFNRKSKQKLWQAVHFLISSDTLWLSRIANRNRHKSLFGCINVFLLFCVKEVSTWNCRTTHNFSSKVRSFCPLYSPLSAFWNCFKKHRQRIHRERKRMKIFILIEIGNAQPMLESYKCKPVFVKDDS